MPWNFPYYQVARFAGPNLVVGNTILLKHAPQCPESAAAMQRIYDDAGFPAGAYTNIYATNDQVADVIADPRVQGVSVTGSERAGAAVAEIAGRNLKKVVLELGGSDPFILLSTDDLDSVVESAVAARLENAGQSCNAAKRFVVAVRPVRAVRGQADGGVDRGRAERSRRRRTRRWARSRRRRRPTASPTSCSGPWRAARPSSAATRSGNFVSPGVLTGVTPSNDAYREELFGPVAIVYRVESEDEAVEVANDTPYGLGSYVFTTDPDQALRVADRIEAGMVFVNIVGADAAELPFGGVKRSGFGRELGRYATEEFVNRKMIRVGG